MTPLPFTAGIDVLLSYAAGCCLARMSWLLPTLLLLFARVLALLPLPVLVRRPSLAHPLLVQVLAGSLAVIALVWLDWEEALAWCLGWLMVLELGIALFRG